METTENTQVSEDEFQEALNYIRDLSRGLMIVMGNSPTVTRLDEDIRESARALVDEALAFVGRKE